MYKKIIEDLTSLINKIECFSAFFVSELADEDLAFNTVGLTYCKIIKQLDFIIKELSGMGYLKNTRKLFNIWNTRLNIKE